MKFLAIDKNPYFISYAVFHLETKKLLCFGTVYFREKDENERLLEIWEQIEKLIKEESPNVVLTHWVNLRTTMKRDLQHIMQIKTILRLVCSRNNVAYNEFKTDGWEKRITNLKQPSAVAKLKIAKEYSPMIDNVGIANAIILGEGVVWGRLQVGKD